MLIDGKWVDNVTCKYCKHRHPESITCGQAKAIAEATATERSAAAAAALKAEANKSAANLETVEPMFLRSYATYFRTGDDPTEAYLLGCAEALDRAAAEIERLREYEFMYKELCE